MPDIDRASNRLWQQNEWADFISSVPQDELYTNDGLNQLSVRQQGRLNLSQTGINTPPVAEEDSR